MISPKWIGPHLRRNHSSPNIHGRGSGSVLTTETQIVRVKHVVGFVRDDWGEGNWTAKDLR